MLRHGVEDLGVDDRLAYFRPAHGLTPELVARYEANRLTVVRQLAYAADETKTLDLALFVNGLPAATAELKNPLTGQNVEHAIAQYRRDRDPQNVTLARRAVVHFAVDPDLVAMTTKLAGAATQFLPFNRGSEDGRRGQPAEPGRPQHLLPVGAGLAAGHWLDLLARFVHVERPEKGSAAEKRGGDADHLPALPPVGRGAQARGARARARRRQQLPGQHSAGSGKSNTIAWLAHRLSSLHDATDPKVFDKVVVITDRLVLDRQLQDTIYQFEHAHGVVVRIDQDSQQLADALAGEQARIIVTTLQKFPFVLDKVEALPARRYAVIVDEAHSSQTGEAAADLQARRSALDGG